MAACPFRTPAVAACAGALAFAAPVPAQKYSEKPARVVIPFAPGGGTDLSDFERLIREETGKWSKIIGALKIKVE